MSGCENQKVLLEKRWCGRASEHRKLRYCDFMFSSRVYKTSKEACHVLCGLPKLYIYSSMEEKKRRGPHTITKKKPPKHQRDGSWSPASLLPVRLHGLARHITTPLSLLGFSSIIYLKRSPGFYQKKYAADPWRVRRTDRKYNLLQSCCGIALGITTVERKRKKDMVRTSLKANRSTIHSWERVGLAKIFPTENTDGHVSWSAALSSFRSRVGVYKLLIGVSAAFFLTSIPGLSRLKSHSWMLMVLLAWRVSLKQSSPSVMSFSPA